MAEPGHVNGSPPHHTLTTTPSHHETLTTTRRRSSLRVSKERAIKEMLNDVEWTGIYSSEVSLEPNLHLDSIIHKRLIQSQLVVLCRLLTTNLQKLVSRY